MGGEFRGIRRQGSLPRPPLLQPEMRVLVLTGCLPWGYILLMNGWEKGPPSFVEAWGCGKRKAGVQRWSWEEKFRVQS